MKARIPQGAGGAGNMNQMILLISNFCRILSGKVSMRLSVPAMRMPNRPLAPLPAAWISACNLIFP